MSALLAPQARLSLALRHCCVQRDREASWPLVSLPIVKKLKMPPPSLYLHLHYPLPLWPYASVTTHTLPPTCVSQLPFVTLHCPHTCSWPSSPHPGLPHRFSYPTGQQGVEDATTCFGLWNVKYVYDEDLVEKEVEEPLRSVVLYLPCHGPVSSLMGPAVITVAAAAAGFPSSHYLDSWHQPYQAEPES